VGDGVTAGDADQMLHADACKMWIEKLAFITTVGELHKAVQSWGG
jgi:hypothetical protein